MTLEDKIFSVLIPISVGVLGAGIGYEAIRDGIEGNYVQMSIKVGGVLACVQGLYHNYKIEKQYQGTLNIIESS